MSTIKVNEINRTIPESVNNYIDALLLEIKDKDDKIMLLQERLISMQTEFKPYWEKYNAIKNILR